MTLSSRAQALLHAPSPLVLAHFRCASEPFDHVTAPEGYINFGTAENHLVWDLVAERLEAVAPPEERHAHYDFLFGSQALRERVAAFLERTARRKLSPESIIIGAGASCILDMLAFALCEPGDGILVPAPYYSGFDQDLQNRSGARIVPVPLEAATGFALTAEALEGAIAQARAEGIRVKALLLTSPHNPTGRVLAREELEAAIAVLKAHDLDGIVDEIYAHSVFGGSKFESVLAIDGGWRDRLHVVYGFAKDFGLSGFKIGVLHTENTAVRDVCRELSLYGSVSTLTQQAMAELLADDRWVDGFLAENRRRLGQAHAVLTRALDAAGIAYAPAEAGLFIWLDLRDRLKAPTFEAERALFDQVFGLARVNITPGAAFHSPEPGWFRLCFAWPEPVLVAGVERLAGALAGSASPR